MNSSSTVGQIHADLGAGKAVLGITKRDQQTYLTYVANVCKIHHIQ